MHLYQRLYVLLFTFFLLLFSLFLVIISANTGYSLSQIASLVHVALVGKAINWGYGKPLADIQDVLTPQISRVSAYIICNILYATPNFWL